MTTTASCQFCNGLKAKQKIHKITGRKLQEENFIFILANIFGNNGFSKTHQICDSCVNTLEKFHNIKTIYHDNFTTDRLSPPVISPKRPRVIDQLTSSIEKLRIQRETTPAGSGSLIPITNKENNAKPNARKRLFDHGYSKSGNYYKTHVQPLKSQIDKFKI